MSGILMLSDLQIGLKTPDYNLKVCQATINSLKEEVETHLSHFKVRRLALLLLGDLVNGDRIGVNVNLAELEFPTHQQIDHATDLIKHLVDSLKSLTDVEIHCIGGNHGIRGRYASWNDNADIEVGKRLREYYKKGVFVYENLVETADIFGMKVLLLHGHQFRYASINSLMTLVDRWSAVSRPDLVCMGHFHRCMRVRTAAGVLVYVNGSLSTGQRWAYETLGATTIPETWLLIVGRDRRVKYELPILCKSSMEEGREKGSKSSRR